MHRANEFRRIIANAVFEDDFGVFDVGYALRGVALDDDKIGILARLDGADGGLLALVDRAVQGRNANGLNRRKPRFDQQFDFPLIAEAGQYAAIARGVGARQQQAAGGDELTLHLHGMRQ